MNSEANHPSFEILSLDEVSSLFTNYQVLELIACGGMGAVYRAIQISLDRHVAIKILPREYSKDEHFRISFETEAKTMARLNHPNLITVYDYGEVDGMIFIIMEYVAGKSLFQITHGKLVDEPYSIELIMDLCRGLEHAHQAGIVHRDMKPSNILLDEKMVPKIGDFGLARPLHQHIEKDEVIYGTPGYTAPEVLRPPYVFDQRADVFSLGVMLHEFLTGFLPSRDARTASQICHCNPRLDLIIRRATFPDPNYRFTTVTEMLRDLENHLSAPAKKMITGLVTVRATPSFRHGGQLEIENYQPPKPFEKKPPLDHKWFKIMIVAAIGLLLVLFFFFSR